MSKTTAAPPRPSNTFLSLAAVGVLVVAAGVMLPRLLSLSPVPATADLPADPTASPFTSSQTPTPPARVEEPAKPLPTPVPAPTPSAPADGREPASLVWVVAKLVFGLAILAGVCIGVARWTNTARVAATPGVLTPLAKLAIDTRCVVHLVGAGGRRLLVGIDAGGVKVQLELPPK